MTVSSAQSRRVWRSESGSACSCTPVLEARWVNERLVEVARRHVWDCPVPSVRLDPRAFAVNGLEVAL